MTATESFPRETWEAWTKNFYDDFGRLLVRRVYHRIPLLGDGEKGEDYAETKYAYDEMGKQIRQVSPDGTITRAVYDSRRLLTSRWTGTDDTGATPSDPTGGGATGNNMVKTLALEYDNGDFDGNGLLTKETRPVDGTPANDQIVEYVYDYRTLMVERKTSDGTTTYLTAYTYDNFGKVIQTDSYHTSVAAGNLTGRTKTHPDALGRIYKNETFAVDPSDGSVGNALRSETWRDPVGNKIKELRQGSEAFQKTVFDGLNRGTATYFACNAGTSTDDNDVSGDMVVEQSERTYNGVGRVLLSTTYQRFHDATGNGALNGPNGEQPKARRYYAAAWFDGINRRVADADFGTNGGTDLVRPSSVPKRSDTVLVTSYRYATEGEEDATVDPTGIETRWEKNAAGRRILLIENHDEDATADDHGANRTTAFGYTAGGLLETLTLKNAVTGDQTTRWVYGTTLEDSGVARGDLLRAKIYSESDDEHDPLGNGPQGEFDRTEYTYNRQGGKITMKDPNGTVHEYVYNPMGKRIHDRVATFGSGAIDDAVKRITTAYDTRGFVATLTSYDDATVGSGTVVNEVAYEYNDFGHLAKDKQEHSGAVDGNTPEVAYAYEDGSSGNTARRTSTTYPDGRVLEYGYGATDSADDLLGRLATIKIQGETDNAAAYAYL
ncbi:MAG: hypothetical protein WD342_08150 [Verrucomicrobiales bacterium]